MSKGIPTVNLGGFIHGDESSKLSFIDELGKAFHEVGFVAVVNHGVDLDMVNNFYESAQRFFKQDLSLKKKYEIEGLAGQRGYTSFGKEHAKQSNVGDLKEFYQIGQVVPSDHPDKEVYPNNVYVKEVPEFTSIGDELYRSFEESGSHLLRAIALYLGLEEHFFEDKIKYGNSILRAIHYPPITQEPKSAIRAEQHEDINLITLLVGASAGGLQLLNKQNEWIDIQPEENEIVVNVGDMLQRLTNNYLRSTTHRVVNPPRDLWHTPRLSIPFFLHPKASMDLSVLESLVDKDHPKAYEDITAGAYLDQRLREIGLKN